MEPVNKNQHHTPRTNTRRPIQVSSGEAVEQVNPVNHEGSTIEISNDSTNSNPPPLNPGSVGFSDNLPQRFIDEVVRSVSGYSPQELGVQAIITTDNLGRPVLNLTHSDNIKGEEKSFNYNIVFSGNNYDLPARIRLGETNTVTLPIDALDEAKKIKTQDAFRALTISDPKLYKRFNKSDFELADYQHEAVDKGSKSLEDRRAAMIVMPTGTGKTVVAWDLMDKYLSQAKANGQKVLFIVNNKLILDGAQKKLRQQLGDKYSMSQVYDQVTDYSGDVIFTTPASLNIEIDEDGKTKLDQLLESNKIAMAIYDEVHHLPANSYAATLRTIKESNPESVHVGFTATPERMDDKDVFEFFGNQVTFELPLFEAKTMGYLTPMKILQCDASINPKNKSPILPGTDLHERYFEERYSKERYPEIAATYRELTKGLDEKKTLILAPNNDKAEELANFFKKQGIPSVALTSRQKSGEYAKDYFDEHYQAWTNGQWNEGSAYAGEKVPQVAVAVDMFREGVDVPDIGCLLLWRYTNSLPLLLQMIGRGLRPSPGKTHLVIGDLVGQTRNLEMMQFLADSIESNRKGKTTITSGEELVQLAKEYGVEIGDEVAESFDSFFKDVPAQMVRRYRAYHRITSETDHQKLEEYIKDVCLESFYQVGIRDGEPREKLEQKFGEQFFYQNFDDAVNRVKHNSLDADLIRYFFEPAFYPYGTDLDDLEKYDRKKIPVTAASEMVYFKIYDLLAKRITNDPDHTKTESILHKLFPEFDPDKYSKIKKRASNLRTLRVEVFKKFSRKDMMQTLLQEVFQEGLISEDQPLYQWLEQINAEMQAADEFSDQTELLAAEELKGDKLGHKPTQDRLIELYSNHPNLKDKLSYDDFELKPEAFRAKLETLGILNYDRSISQMLTKFRQEVKNFTEANENDTKAKLQSLTELLSGLDLERLNTDSISVNNFQNFVDIIKDLTDSENLANNPLSKETQELLSKLDKVIEKFITISLQKDPQSSNTSVLYRASPNSKSYRAEVLNSSSKYPFLYLLSSYLGSKDYMGQADIALKTDSLGRTNICLRAFQEFEKLYDQATSDEAKQKITRAAIESFEDLLKGFDLTNLVFIIGKKRFEDGVHDISAALAKHLKANYDNDVIIGASFSHVMTPSIEKPFDLSADSVTAPLSRMQSTILKQPGTQEQSVNSFYQDLYKVRDLVQPTISSLKNRASKTNPQTTDGKAALAFLKEELEDGSSYKMQFRYTKNLVEALRSILDSSSDTAELNEEQIRLSAASIFFNHPSKTGHLGVVVRAKIQGMLNQYSWIIKQSREHDEVELPQEIFTEMQGFLDFTLDAIRNKSTKLIYETLIPYIRSENNLFTKVNTLYLKSQEAIRKNNKTAISSAPAENTQSQGSAEAPPFFDKNGKLAFWLTHKKDAVPSLRKAAYKVHWDKACTDIEKAHVSKTQSVTETTFDELELRGLTSGNRGKVSLCTKCGTDKPTKPFDSFTKADNPAGVIEHHGQN